MVSKSKELLQTSNSNLTILQYTKNILWENAIISNGAKGEILEVPLILLDHIGTMNNDPETLKDFHRLLFMRDDKNNLKVYHLQVITNPKSFDNLSSDFNFYSITANFDGLVTLTDSNKHTVDYLRFEDAEKIKPSKSAKEAAVTCLYFGWWYEDGSFRPISLISCSTGGGGETTGYGYHGGGGYSTGPVATELPIIVVSPDIPIINLVDYLKCININQGATITIYADQPLANSSNSSYLGNVGHAFISIEQNGILKSFGFYPASGGIASANPLFVPVYGTMGNDNLHTYDVSISANVDSATLKNIINFSTINQHATYDLNNNNCTDFTIGVARLVGLNVSDCYSSFGQGIIGGGSNPGKFGQELRNLTLPSGFTRNKNTGSAPNNKGICN